MDVSKDLRAGPAGSAEAAKTFESLAYSGKKEYVGWIEAAKKPETRARRFAEAVARLKAGRGRVKRRPAAGATAKGR